MVICPGCSALLWTTNPERDPHCAVQRRRLELSGGGCRGSISGPEASESQTMSCKGRSMKAGKAQQGGSLCQGQSPMLPTCISYSAPFWVLSDLSLFHQQMEPFMGPPCSLQTQCQGLSLLSYFHRWCVWKMPEGSGDGHIPIRGVTRSPAAPEDHLTEALPHR